MDWFRYTAHELLPQIRSGAVSAEEVTAAVFAQIHKIDPVINGYITLLEEPALEQARSVDTRVARGEPVGALAGIPVAVKDLICTRGVPTTCGSRILANFVPPYDATVVKALQAADAVLIGKTNMDEFAMGSSNENSSFGVVTNPVDPTRVPGGSSGGSAACVAAHETILALGSDTGGSIRQPAAFCGVIGLKPTYGRVSRFGLVAFASSLDQIGPITKDVSDVALLLNVIAGHDAHDSTSADVPVPDYTASLSRDIKAVRLGIPKEYFGAGLDPEVEAAVRGAIDRLAGLGAEVEEVSLPHTEYAIATYYIIATAEASSNLARYDGVRYGYRTEHPKDLMNMYWRTRSEGFGAEVKRRIMLGTYVLSSGYYDAYYAKAQKVRSLVTQDFRQVFQRCDALLTPTAPTTAFHLGEKIDDPLQMYLSDIYTVSVNMAGIPGISLPCGRSSEGLPIGLQILGRHFDEETILRVAYAFEQHELGNSTDRE